jgi:uncharacterized membrane protein YphA (DoxX/SURF4 family)
MCLFLNGLDIVKGGDTGVIQGSNARESGRFAVAALLVRVMLGSVFVAEGVQKFLFPEALGVGRFIKIGIPFPEVMAPFVGVVETVCGLMLLAGLFTRLAAIPLVIDMLVAIATTKIPILMEKGFWAMVHETRTDWSMLLGAIVLLIVGSGGWSLDSTFARRGRKPRESGEGA